MKKIIYTTAIALLGTTAMGQQLAQFSQYMHNPYVLNPAAAGMNDYLDINLSYRQQWAGFDNAPTTYYLSATKALGKRPAKLTYNPSLRTSDIQIKPIEQKTPGKLKHALGGYVIGDNYGVFEKISGGLSYALHIPVGNTMYASIGLGAGASNYSIDQNQLTLGDAADNTFTTFIGSGTSQTYFDLNGGVALYSDKLYFGYSGTQVIENEIYFGSEATQAALLLHHFISAGYKIQAGENLSITPGFVVKYLNPAPVSYDLNMKFEFKDKFWIGAAYRNEDAIVGLLGLKINDLIKIGYSYDYTTSNLGDFNSGGHEVVLGLMIGN